jgi:hypothetical protein
VLFVERTGRDDGAAVVAIMYRDAPRLTADLAVLHIVLLVATAGIERDRILFATVRTHDGPNGVCCAVAEGKVAVEVEFVFGEIHDET